MNPEPHLRAIGIPPNAEADPTPPIDPRTIPRADWHSHEAAALQLTDEIAAYLAGRDYTTEPFTADEITAIENRLTVLFALPPDYQATHAAGAFRLQRLSSLRST